jgi:hypothetical protein
VRGIEVDPLFPVLRADIVSVKEKVVDMPLVFGTSKDCAIGCDNEVGELELVIVSKHLTPPSLFVITVKAISRDTAPTSIKDAVKDSVAADPDKFLPRISPAVTSVNVTGILVDKEDPKMLCIRLAGCCERGAVFAKINDVINADSVNVNRAHSTPP